jgi:heat shock protein HtpX
MLHLGGNGAQPWFGDRWAPCAVQAAQPPVPLVPVPTALPAAVQQFFLCPATGTIKPRFSSSGPGPASAGRILGHSPAAPLLQRHLHRAVNQRNSGQVIAGMVLLLALCGWISGGEDGARRAVTDGAAPSNAPPISPEAMQRQFGARLLRPHEMPAVFDMLRDICRRAHLPRLPDLYYVADPDSMNAYALGRPERSAITVTEGLLRGLTPRELAAILAHEVAHIRNNDGSAMSWAAALQRAISLSSVVGLMTLQRYSGGPATPAQPLALVLRAASGIAQLLCLALSRVRELDADALALDLINDPQALVAALHKLERHHAGRQVAAMAARNDDLVRLLRSHPATCERVGMLLKLAH